MNNTNEISKTDNSGFLAVKDFNLNNMVSQEMEGLNVSFERIKIPSGGTTMWTGPVKTDNRKNTPFMVV